MRIRWILFPLAAVSAAAAEPPPAPPAGADDFYRAGQQLFDQYAPPEIKRQYAFPSKDQWDEFASRLQRALDNNSLEQLAPYEPGTRAALAALQAFPGYEDYSAWLALRLDEIEAAAQAAGGTGFNGPGAPALPHGPPIPFYNLWLARVRNRPAPAGAAALMPALRAAFAAEGVPPALAWLAEAESGFNPAARSPVGAKGLFQFTPETAQTVGLRTFLPDERTEPAPSARAAARLLRALYAKFGSWPLALAAYNSGEGRISRLLRSRKADDFSGVAPFLPSETRMYVPKVLALIAVRTGLTPESLPAPSPNF